MTLFSNDSTILEEVSIDYDENKVATYDNYCDDTYAIKVVMIIFIKLIMIMITLFLNITLLMWKQFIVFESLMILPLFRLRRIFLMWRVIKFLCWKECFMWWLYWWIYSWCYWKIIMRKELMIHDDFFMLQSLSFMRASLNPSCLAKRH